MQCPTCGAQVDEDAEICPECGMDLSAAAPQSEEKPVTAEPPAVSVPIETTPAAPSAQTAAEPVPAPGSIAVAPAVATLTLKRAGALTPEVFNLGDRVIIGRFDAESGPVDVDLGPLPESTYISRHHAEIFKNPEGKWMIHDLGSTNGTFVMNRESMKFEKVQGEQEITNDEEIAFGNARFIFKTV